MATSLVAELAEKLSSATNNLDFDEQTIFLNTSADTVGIGTNSPASKLDVRGTMQVGVNDTGYDVKFFGATAGAYLEWDESADELEIRGGAATPGKLLLSTAETTVVDGNKLGQIDFQAPVDSAGTDAILVGASIYAEADATFSSSVNATELVFATGASEAATEKMRIASDGNVGIGISTPSSQFTVKSTSSANITQTNFYSTGGSLDATNTSDFYFLRYWDESTDYRGARLRVKNSGYSDKGGSIQVQTSKDGTANQWNDGLIIDKAGKVGIGTTAPGMPLHVYSAENNLLHLESTDQDALLKLEDNGTGHFQINVAADTASFGTSHSGEMMRISGSSSPEAVVFNEDGNDQDFRIETDDNNSMFCVDGSTDRVGIGTATPQYVHQVYGSVDTWLMQIENVTGSTPYGFKYSSSNAAPDNNTQKAFEFTDSVGDRFQVYSDGDVKNHDGAYGSISDERIKTEITDANSQWDDIEAIRVVNFKRKDDVKQYGEKAWKQLGVVAQELEAVCPKIVRNSPPNDFEIQECGFGEQDSDGKWVRKKDSDGNELEVKGVPYSILQMKAFKALQEAMAKIETLETKVKTLEDA